MTEGTFLEWKISEGEKVEEDQVVGEAETDKAVVEIPAPSDGKVNELLVEAGETVEVGEVIMKLETSSETKEETQEQEKEEKKERSKPGNDIPDRSLNSDSVLALPKVRKKASEEGIDLNEIQKDGRITMEDLENLETSSKTEDQSNEVEEDVKATPSVRRLAREQGIDISNVEGSGKGGKITRQDVKNFEETQEQDEDESEDTCQASQGRTESLSSLEQNVARKMTNSRFSAPHVTHVEKADVTELVELREKANDEVNPHLTYMPFIMKATVLAMQDYPRMNAHFDDEEMEVSMKETYDFNIAVDTEDGLLVPRLDNVKTKNLLEIALELSHLVEKAQEGEITSKEMAPGSFSITNLGVIGGEEFTPIINPPQTCILGVGKIQETAEVVDGDIVPRMTMKLSFSYDHRVIDGATAARFINEIVENLENPEEMMVSI